MEIVPISSIMIHLPNTTYFPQSAELLNLAELYN
jgi:hypothetical protein